MKLEFVFARRIRRDRPRLALARAPENSAGSTGQPATLPVNACIRRPMRVRPDREVLVHSILGRDRTHRRERGIGGADSGLVAEAVVRSLGRPGHEGQRRFQQRRP